MRFSLSHAERHAAYAHWPEEWLAIAAPIVRLPLTPAQTRAMAAPPALPDAAPDPALVAAVLEETGPDPAAPWRVFVDDPAQARHVLPAPGGPRVAPALRRPWRAVRLRALDALEAGYAMHLALLDEARFPPQGWQRCLIEAGRIGAVRPVGASPAHPDTRQAIAAACRAVTAELLAGASGNRWIADLAIWREGGMLQAGLICARTARPGTGPDTGPFAPPLNPPPEWLA